MKKLQEVIRDLIQTEADRLCSVWLLPFKLHIGEVKSTEGYFIAEVREVWPKARIEKQMRSSPPNIRGPLEGGGVSKRTTPMPGSKADKRHRAEQMERTRGVLAAIESRVEEDYQGLRLMLLPEGSTSRKSASRKVVRRRKAG